MTRYLMNKLLSSYFEYSNGKNTNDFDAKTGKIYIKFGDYKYFQYYKFIMKGYKDNLISTIAYFTKNSSYFQKEFNIYVFPNNIQTVDFILNLSEILKKKELVSDLTNKVDNLEKILNAIALKNETMQTAIKSGESQREELETKIKYLSEKITQFNEDAKIKTVQLKNMQVDKVKADTQIQNLDIELKVMQEDKVKTRTQIQNLDIQLKVMQEDINKLDTQLQDLLNNKKNSDLQIQDIKNENENLKKDIAELKCRMDKIDPRDT